MARLIHLHLSYPSIRINDVYRNRTAIGDPKGETNKPFASFYYLRSHSTAILHYYMNINTWIWNWTKQNKTRRHQKSFTKHPKGQNILSPVDIYLGGEGHPLISETENQYYHLITPPTTQQHNYKRYNTQQPHQNSINGENGKAKATTKAKSKSKIALGTVTGNSQKTGPGLLVISRTIE